MMPLSGAAFPFATLSMAVKVSSSQYHGRRRQSFEGRRTFAGSGRENEELWTMLSEVGTPSSAAGD